jgi:outer membrane protein OmpA-like peptidoglycan-associated protein
LNITLRTGVNVTGPAANLSGNAIDIVNDVSDTKTFVVMENGAAINVAGSLTGLHVQQGFPATINTPSDATVTAAGTINIQSSSRQDAIGVFTTHSGAAASVIYTGPSGGVAGGGLDLMSSGASNGTIIQANTQGASGDALVHVVSGNMLGFLNSGERFFQGLGATVNGDGNATVLFDKGTLTVEGRNAAGIFAGNGDGGGGEVKVVTGPDTHIIDKGTNPGDITPTLGLTPGITAESGGLAAKGGKITVTVASTIEMFGPATPALAAPPSTPNASILNYPVALRSIARADAPISVNYTGAGITTSGGGGIGILAYSTGPATSSSFGGSGSVTVNSSGPITTTGAGALGIVADSGTLRNATRGLPAQPGGAIMVTASGAISTQGDLSHGIWASSTTSPVQVTVSATNVSTTGQFSVGINAVSPGIGGTGGGDVMVSILPGGSVMGGWQADLTSVGSDPTGNFGGLPSAGVILTSLGGTTTLINNGSIGALSDRAIAGDPQVTNNGTITGFVQFTGSNNSIDNFGTFNLRHFADTNGDGARDTVRVAVADLGTGRFTNNGTLALPQVSATALDSTGQYLPLGNRNNAMALNGPLQGQLIGVATFTNSGTINLQSNPAPGDVLVITGARQAGVAGPGNFVSNGGVLKLDTVLNAGGATTQSDTLVVDGTSVGSGGATRTLIRNAGGTGAETPGNGILVVEVKDPNHSSANAFEEGNLVAAGAFTYGLFRGPPGGANAADGNWYLRNVIRESPETPEIPTTPPIIEIPPEVLPPGLEEEAGPDELPPGTQPGDPIPIYRPGAALYSAVPGVARDMALEILSTFHERAGEQFLVNGYGINGNGWLPAVWARGYGTHLDQGWTGTVAPRFDGTKFGFQAGFDVFRFESIPGHRDYVGLFAGYSNAQGDVDGELIGLHSIRVGSLSLNAAHVGGYWQHIGPSEWYVDAVAMGSFYGADPASITSDAAHVNGKGFTGSLEAGYPIPLPIPLRGSWHLEPQVQAIYQTFGFNSTTDSASSVSFNTNGTFVIRGGLRLMDTLQLESGALLQPYARVNVWHTARATDSIVLGADTIGVGQAASSIEFGGGVVAKLNQNFGVWAYVSTATSISSAQRLHTLGGTVGVRYTFGAPPPPPAPALAPAPAAARSYLVFFDWDKATLTDRARQIIREASDNSTKVQYTRIEVNGYTDTSGTPKYNQGLSIRRAQAVQSELIKDGVPANAITIQGFGDTHLLVPTGPGVREPQNRRVEIVIQ